jgi:hypothetical protein
MIKPNGAILWEGASLLNGAPIVAIATGLASKSSNRKTGAMVQTYILRSDISPIDAVRTGADASICGNCPHRGQDSDLMALSVKQHRTCYVNVGQGPRAVFSAYRRGAYPLALQANGGLAGVRLIGADRIVRLGTYGDPAAVPANVWLALVHFSRGHTGYTHQWRNAPELSTLCMASVDSVNEAREAQALGWRTFRVDTSRAIGAQRGEVLCPASKEAGKKLTCEKCLACGGADSDPRYRRRGSIYIPAHGGFAVMANLRHFGRSTTGGAS